MGRRKGRQTLSFGGSGRGPAAQKKSYCSERRGLLGEVTRHNGNTNLVRTGMVAWRTVQSLTGGDGDLQGLQGHKQLNLRIYVYTNNTVCLAMEPYCSSGTKIARLSDLLGTGERFKKMDGQTSQLLGGKRMAVS